MNDVMTVRSVRSSGLNPRRITELPTTTDSLVYGPPKLGKTTFAASAQEVPEMGNYLHVAIERGEETLRDVYPDTDALFLDEDDNGHWLETAEQRWDRMNYIYSELKASGHGYGTVALDTLDELQSINLEFNRVDSPAVQAGNQDIEVASPREYGKSLIQMKRIIRQFQNLPMNVIWICHAKDDINERTKRREKKPMLVGQFQDLVGGMVNNLFYLTIEPATKTTEATRVLVTAADGEIQAGTRSRVLNDMGFIDDPTFSKVWYPLTGTQPSA